MGETIPLSRRPDYTHQYNAISGRHGWLRLTPAYSVKMVEEILEAYPNATHVLDPFCGTGTTALCAIRRGIPAATTDINPFLIWLANAKTRMYSQAQIDETRRACQHMLQLENGKFSPIATPPIHRIERWWSEESMRFLCKLKGAINQVPLSSESCRDLLNIAFCRTLIGLSNAAFNHQSMSFKDGSIEFDLSVDHAGLYSADLEHVLTSAPELLREQAQVRLCDARQLETQALGPFDVVVTSPPYANRMSYVRELRPYMYWLGYLRKAREAGELDWQAIGGTWGVATSRLNDWDVRTKYANPHLSEVIAQISKAQHKNSRTLSRYVHKYCEDIYAHLASLVTTLGDGARAHYIVGNSSFYGTLVNVERIYADMMDKVGFSDINIRAIRKRNSKKELVEFDVSASWQK